VLTPFRAFSISQVPARCRELNITSSNLYTAKGLYVYMPETFASCKHKECPNPVGAKSKTTSFYRGRFHIISWYSVVQKVRTLCVSNNRNCHKEYHTIGRFDDESISP
jgi:hypothetical protein